MSQQYHYEPEVKVDLQEPEPDKFAVNFAVRDDEGNTPDHLLLNPWLQGSYEEVREALTTALERVEKLQDRIRSYE